MSVLSTLMVVIKFAPTQWDHSVVAAEVAIVFQAMEELALVGSKHDLQ